MMTRRSLAASIAAFGLGGCVGPAHRIRYRLTLDVETPEGVASGSSVIEVAAHVELLLGAGRSLIRKVTGEAVAVDLGRRGVLFCLLTGDPLRPKTSKGVDELFQYVLPGNGDHSAEGFFRDIDDWQARKPKADVPLDRLPMLVRFGDMSDPRTVERVDPKIFSATLGADVRLMRATTAVTDDPITVKIKQKLSWLDAFYDKRLDGNRFEFLDAKDRLANMLSSGAFQAKEY